MTTATLPTVPMPRQDSERLVMNDPNRPGWAPIPLAPRELLTPDLKPYSLRSIDIIQNRINEQQGKHPDWLLGAAYVSLLNLHMSRCKFSDDAYLRFRDRLVAEGRVLPEEAQRLIRLAKLGEATPLDLLKLRGMGVGLEKEGTGLGKESHFPSYDTVNMDTAANTAIGDYESNPQWLDKGANRRYTVYRAVGSYATGGLIVVRKRNVAMVDNTYEKRRQGIQPSVIVKRSSFVLRYDDALSADEQPSPRLLWAAKPLRGHDDNKAISREASQRIAAVSDELEELIYGRAKCLVPLATSYYARPADVCLPKAERKDARVQQYFTPQMGAVALAAA